MWALAPATADRRSGYRPQLGSDLPAWQSVAAASIQPMPSESPLRTGLSIVSARSVLLDISLNGVIDLTTFSHIFERLRQVRDQVFDVLDANRNPDQRISQTNLFAQFTRDTRMGHGGWM